MRLSISELPNHLKRGLQSFYFVHGDEPFLCLEACELIRAEAKNQGYTERERYEITDAWDWQGFKANLSALTLFSNKRIIDCRFREDKIGKTAAQALLEIAASPPPDILFLCSTNELDAALRKASWFAALERQVVVLWARPLSREAFSLWLKNRIYKAQLTISEEIYDMLLERTEGNLLAAVQAIEKLQLLQLGLRREGAGALTLETVNQLISVESRFSIFELVDALLMGSISRTQSIFFSLKNEGIEPLLVLWAVTREVRTIIPLARILEAGGPLSQGFREYPVWKTRVEKVKIFLNRVSVSFLHQYLIRAKNLDDLLKGKRLGDGWTELYALCLMLARGCYV